jgi:hypothetical protein
MTNIILDLILNVENKSLIPLILFMFFLVMGVGVIFFLRILTTNNKEVEKN